jgi:uncharacterized membrane protein
MSTSSIERFGEMVLQALEAFLNKIALFLRGLVDGVKDIDRTRLYPFFEKRKIQMQDYSVFKLQLSSALFLILTILFIINSLDFKRYLAFGTLLTIFNIYLIFSTLKDEFKEFKAYRDLFLSFYFLLLFLAVIKIKKPFVDFGFPFFHFVVVAIGGALAIYIYFDKKYSRDFTYGRVLSDKGASLEIQFNYDILSSVKPQVAIIRKTMNARKGDVVKVSVKKGFLSLRGSTPVEILGVEWK